jgi:hypothetical protein
VRGRLHNNEMQRTAPGKDGAPPLISVFGRPIGGTRVSVTKRVGSVLLVGLTFLAVFAAVLLIAAWSEIMPPQLPQAAVPLYVIVQLGVPIASAWAVRHALRKRWGGAAKPAPRPVWQSRALVVLVVGYALTVFFGLPAVQSDQTAWAVDEYKRVRDHGSRRVFEQHPYIRSFAAIPVAPGFVLSYHEYQLDGLYGLGAFQLYLWYGTGTKSLGCLPIWIS